MKQKFFFLMLAITQLIRGAGFFNGGFMFSLIFMIFTVLGFFKKMINIIKSGVGNIGSLIKVINDLEYNYRIISDPSEFTNTKKIILPGVGSFDSFINSLKDQNLFDRIFSLVKKQNYSILGICVGMQSLFKKSEEGILNGLDLVDGECIKFKLKNQKFLTLVGII